MQLSEIAADDWTAASILADTGDVRGCPGALALRAEDLKTPLLSTIAVARSFAGVLFGFTFSDQRIKGPAERILHIRVLLSLRNVIFVAHLSTGSGGRKTKGHPKAALG